MLLTWFRPNVMSDGDLLGWTTDTSASGIHNLHYDNASATVLNVIWNAHRVFNELDSAIFPYDILCYYSFTLISPPSTFHTFSIHTKLYIDQLEVWSMNFSGMQKNPIKSNLSNLQSGWGVIFFWWQSCIRYEPGNLYIVIQAILVELEW